MFESLPATPSVGFVIWQGFLDELNFAGFKGVRDKSCLPLTRGHLCKMTVGTSNLGKKLHSWGMPGEGWTAPREMGHARWLQREGGTLCQHDCCLWLCVPAGTMCVIAADHSESQRWQQVRCQLGHSRLGGSIRKAVANNCLFQRGTWSSLITGQAHLYLKSQRRYKPWPAPDGAI